LSLSAAAWRSRSTATGTSPPERREPPPDCLLPAAQTRPSRLGADGERRAALLPAARTLQPAARPGQGRYAACGVPLLLPEPNRVQRALQVQPLGQFNVPFGSYRRIAYVRDFSAYHARFANWDFTAGDFEAVALAPDDFVYADPPTTSSSVSTPRAVSPGGPGTDPRNGWHATRARWFWSTRRPTESSISTPRWVTGSTAFPARAGSAAPATARLLSR